LPRKARESFDAVPPSRISSISLWDFALACWAKPGFEAAALRLQDRDGLDVGTILFCLWAAGRSATPHGATPLGLAQLGAVLATARPWRENVILPMRRARRRLKAAVPSVDPAQVQDLVGMMSKAELSAERHLLEALERQHSPLAAETRSSDAAEQAAWRNVSDYVSLTENQVEGPQSMSDESRADFAVLIGAVFAGAPPEK
jgi:uncharacterized protein (TIGR02444 family)